MDKCIDCGNKDLKEGKMWICNSCGESYSDEIASENIAKILDSLKEKFKISQSQSGGKK